VPRASQRIVVAWRRDPHAKRALHAALPLLQRARHVEVVAVNAKSNLFGEGLFKKRAVRGYFTRHGIASEFHGSPQNGPIATGLLSRVNDIQGDLVLMGVYHCSAPPQVAPGGLSDHVF
jgi:hypothetical protein